MAPLPRYPSVLRGVLGDVTLLCGKDVSDGLHHVGANPIHRFPELKPTFDSGLIDLPKQRCMQRRVSDAIESMISVCREHAGNVKRWHDGRMALRWCAAGMAEAGQRFRRVNGHLHRPTLRSALEREIAEPVGPLVHNDQVNAA